MTAACPHPRAHCATAAQRPACSPMVTGAQRLNLAREGWLTVHGGRAWLTGAAWPGDQVLEDGQPVHLPCGQDWVIEPWQAGQALRLSWQPDSCRSWRAVSALRAALAAGLQAAGTVLLAGAGALR